MRVTEALLAMRHYLLAHLSKMVNYHFTKHLFIVHLQFYIYILTIESSTFLNHFLCNYGLETVDKLQPLVEIKDTKLNMNFISNKVSDATQQEAGKSNYRTLFIGKHVFMYGNIDPGHPKINLYTYFYA